MKDAYILTSYQEQDNTRREYRDVINSENVVLRLNYVPKGSVVFVSGFNIESDRKWHGKDYDIRNILEVRDYFN